MASGREIALSWVAAIHKCPADRAYALRLAAEATAVGFDEAEADILAGTEDETRGMTPDPPPMEDPPE